MYDREIKQLKEIVKGVLVIDNPESLHHLDKGFEIVLDILYDKTYNDGYAQGWEEGYSSAESEWSGQ